MHQSAVYKLALAILATESAAQSQSQCPDGNGPSILNGKSVCCPGILQSNTNCLVGCTLGKPACFPFCSDQPNDLTTKGQCTTVPLTASDYTSRVYSMGGSGSGSGNGGSQTTTDGGASSATDDAGSSPTPTDSISSSGATSGDQNGADLSSSSTSSGGAAARVTEAPGLALAAIMAGVALL